MTPLKCVHLNSVTRFILITILVSIFSQSFDCKAINSVIIGASEQGFISQPIDPPITNDKPSGNNDTKGLGNISQPNDNGSRPEINLNKPLECTVGTCIYMAPAITTNKPLINNDTTGLDRKRQVVDPSTNDNFGDNANDDKSDEKDEFISPENLLFSLQDYKIVMEPSVEKVNALDYKVILHVNVRRKSDDGKVMELPSVAMYANNENPLALNSSIVESLKKNLNDSLSLSKLNGSLENNTRDTTGNSTNLTPTEFSANLAEGPTNDPITDLSGRKNETTNAVSSPTLNISESGINSENNTFDATSSTTTELPTTPEPIPSLTPLPPNEVDKRQENSPIQPETTTKSKLEITTITTSKPIDKTSASTLSSQVGSSETSHASSNAFSASTEVSRAVESRTISSTSNPLQTSSSSSMQPKMSEIEINHLKSLSDKQNYKPIKPIPETPWIPAYEVKPIGFNKQDTDNHIEYRFTQHEEEFNNRRNIPSNQPKLQPQPRPQLQPQPKLQPQPQPQPRPAPRLPPKSRYEPGMDMRSYNDRQPQVVKYDPYVPRNPSVPLKDLRANAPNNRNEPYAVEEIVHFEGPMQRLNTRQQKPSPELFVRIIRHYFENALSPAETVYTTKHKSPIIAPGQPVYQRSPASLSYQNSKP